MRERALIVAQLFIALAGALSVVGFLTYNSQTGDVRLYEAVARRVSSGEMPYADFAVEYPPLALAPMLVPWFVPSAAPDTPTYAIRFGVQNALLILATAALVLWIGHRWRPAPLAMLPLVAAFLPFGVLLAYIALWRFDIFPAVLSLAAFGLFVAGRHAAAGGALAASIGAKLYAAPLAPLFVASAFAAGRVRHAGFFVAGFAAVGVVVFAPFVMGSDMTMTFLGHQDARGLHVESSWGGLLGLAHAFGGLPATIEFAFGAHEIISPWTETAVALAELALPIGSAAVLGIGLLRVAEVGDGRVNPPTESLVSLTVALLLTVMLANKVLSPQYLVWTLPFAALLPTGPRLLLLGATALTAVEFPFAYPLVLKLTRGGVIMLNMRNALLLGTLLWLLYRERPRQPRAVLGRTYAFVVAAARARWAGR